VTRLLIVLAVVILAAFYLNYGTHRVQTQTMNAGDEPAQEAAAATTPQGMYQQNTGKARALEQQMQQQAQSQLESIDAREQ
jgi:hypothetical protein